MKSCLAHAAPEFVTFCIAQLQFMQAGIGSPGEYNGELANQPNVGPMLIDRKHRRIEANYIDGDFSDSARKSYER